MERSRFSSTCVCFSSALGLCFWVGFFFCVPCHCSANGSTHISELWCGQADKSQVPLQLLSTKHTAH